MCRREKGRGDDPTASPADAKIPSMEESVRVFMEAAVVRRLGTTPRVEEFPEPPPDAGHVLVRVRAAAVTSATRAQVLGGGPDAAVPPFVPGLEGVGQLANGDLVSFTVRGQPHGALGALTVAHDDAVYPVPAGVSEVAAAAAFWPGMSSWCALRWHAALAPGESVLVLGATGNIGQVAVQAARLLGAKKVVAAGHDREALADSHADAAIPLGLDDAGLSAVLAAAGPFDIVLDLLAGRPARLLLGLSGPAAPDPGRTRWLRLAGGTPPCTGTAIDTGTGTSIGTDTGTDTATAADTASDLADQAGVRTIEAACGPPPETLHEYHHAVMSAVAGGTLDVPTRSLPLAQVARAWNQPGTHRRTVLCMRP